MHWSIAYAFISMVVVMMNYTYSERSYFPLFDYAWMILTKD